MERLQPPEPENDDGTDTDAGAAVRRRLRDGDRDAFAGLYEEHVRAVHRHALRLTGDWSTAEEIVSETFFTAWRTRERVEPQGGSVLPWLLGIATHKAHNANRGLRRRLAFLAHRPAPPQVDDIADTAVTRVDDARRLVTVHTALRRLRRQDREVLALCVGEELTPQQAAEALGIPAGTVRSRLSRARSRLRALLDDDAGAGTAPAGPPSPGARAPRTATDPATVLVPLRLSEESR